jgi:hypothetical protein
LKFYLCIYEILSLPDLQTGANSSITIINFKLRNSSPLAKKSNIPELSCVIVVRADIFDGASIPSKSTSLFSSSQK